MHKILVSLIGVNLLLMASLGFLLSHQKARPSGPLAVSGGVPEAARAGRAATRPKARTAPEKVTWASFSSPDLRKYAENLRRVGCPEQTIKDIMLAEVNRAYGPKASALKARADDVAPWERVGPYDRRSGESKLRQLLEEKRSLLKESTGVDVGVEMPSRLAGRDVEKFEGAFGALAEDKRDQVRAIQENYWAQSDDVKQRTLGYLEPEDRDEFLRLKTERKEALSKLLTPRELQDYELATSDTAPAVRSRMKGFDVTDEELRKIFDYMQPLDDKFSLSRRNPDPVDTEFTAARTQAEKDLQEYIHTALGDDRYAEYQRTRDPAYQTINQLGTEAGLSKDAIVQAYQAQQQMQTDAQRVMQDQQLTPEQRAQALTDVRAQAQQKLQQFLGDKAGQVLQRLPDTRLAERYGLPADSLRMIANPGANNNILIQP